MPNVSGNLKTNGILFQGKGVTSRMDYKLTVERAGLNDELHITRGDEILMSVAPEENDQMSQSDNGNTSVSADRITFNVPLTINGTLSAACNVSVAGSLSVGSNTVFNAKISTECKNALSNLVVESAWKPEYGLATTTVTGAFGAPCSILTLPYTSNVFTPMAAVHIYKNGDEYQYQSGLFSAVPANSNVRVNENTKYWMASMTKTVTVLMYARMKTLGVFPQGNGAKMVDYFPNMSNIDFLVPSLSASSNASTLGSNLTSTSNALPWVNGVAPTRDLYLDDIFSESVGFHCGFDANNASLNPLLALKSFPELQPAFYSAADKIYGYSQNTLLAVSASNAAALATSNYQAHINTPTSNATSNAAIASNAAYAAAGAALAGSTALITNYAFIWNPSANPALDTTGFHPDEFFNYWLSTYDGTKLVQLYDHGKFNYNSSENFGTAVIRRAYVNKYPAASNMTYYQILDKELLTPLGSTLSYKTIGANGMFSAVPNLVGTWQHSAADDAYIPNTSYNFEVPSYSSFQPLIAGGASYTNKNDYGNLGLVGTLADYSKVAQVIARKGLDQNGRRLINASEIANLMIPRITVDETSQLTLQLVFGASTRTFALGGMSRGPSYENGFTTSPSDFLPAAGPQGSLTVKQLGTDSHYPAPLDEHGWQGACGTYVFICPEKETVLTLAMEESGSGMGWYKFVRPAMEIIRNEYFDKAVNIYTTPRTYT